MREGTHVLVKRLRTIMRVEPRRGSSDVDPIPTIARRRHTIQSTNILSIGGRGLVEKRGEGVLNCG